MKWKNSLNSVFSSLQTGDALLFSGNSILSKMIKLFTKSHWSHIGIVFVDENKTVFCWESDNTPVSPSFPEIGVRMVPLEEKIKFYNGEVAVRQVVGLTSDELRRMQDSIICFSNEIKGRPYEKSILELILAAYDGPFGKNSEDLSSIFCSELIAAVYQRVGLLPFPPVGLPSNEYTPADFSRSNFKLLKASLSEIIFIKNNAKGILSLDSEKTSSTIV